MKTLTLKRLSLLLVLTLMVGAFSGVPLAKAEYSPDNANKPDTLATQKNAMRSVQVGEFTGAALYEVPIEVPEGRRGMTPTIGITYNSQSEDLESVAGYRWSLSEFSIQRINKKGVEKLYTENFFTAQTPAGGGELLPITLADESHGLYGEKIEQSDSKYEYLADGSWKVTDAQGTVYIFGLNAAARQADPADATRIYRWMLESVTDLNGNTITYEYAQKDNQIYPKTIKYASFEIRFLPFANGDFGAERPDKHTGFDKGFRVDSKHLLTGIEIKEDSTVRRRYDLTYTTIAPLVRQTLAQVQETGFSKEGISTTLPPTVFSYTPSLVQWQEVQDFLPNWLFELCYHECAGGKNIMEWDMNGDSLIDYEAFTMQTGNNVSLRARNTGSGWAYEAPQILPNGTYAGGDVSIPGPDRKPVDFDGDGRMDIIRSGINRLDGKMYSDIRFASGSNVSGVLDVAILWPEYINQDNGANIADLNGDGLPDLIQSHKPYGSREVLKSTCLNEEGNRCVTTPLWQAPFDFIYSEQDHQVRKGMAQDCNNDGLSDIRFIGSGAMSHVNDGKGGWITDPNDFQCRFDNMESNTRRLVDGNGDGLMDFAEAYRTYNSTGYTETNVLHINTGNGSYDQERVLPILMGEYSGVMSDYGVRIADLNGDLLPDFIQSFSYLHEQGNNVITDTVKKVYMNRGSRPYFLKTVQTPSGGTVNIEYSTSAQQRKADGSQANPNLPHNITVVSKITTEDGLGGPAQTAEYRYEDGHYYYNTALDRNLAGFRIVSVKDALGNVTKTYFHQGENSVADEAYGEFQDHWSKQGRSYRVEQVSASGMPLQVQVSRWQSEDLGNGRMRPLMMQSVSTLKSPDRSTATSITYDVFGNPTHIEDWGEVQAQNDGNFTDVGTDLIVEDRAYAQNEEAHLLRFPKETTQSDQNGTVLNRSRVYYDDLELGAVQKGNATAQETWFDTESRWIRSATAYNEFGLPVSSTDALGNMTTMAYETAGLYPSEIINPLGQKQSFEYDIFFGAPLKETDPNGAVKVTKYDGLGRAIQSQINAVTAQEVIYTDQSLPRQVFEKSYDGQGESVEKYTLLDGLMRPTESRIEAADGQFTTTRQNYDERGLLKQKIMPGNVTVSYAYDSLGRMTSTTSPLGMESVAYEGWNKTVTDLKGRTKHFVADARGNLKEVHESKDSETYITRYDYNAKNQLVRITDTLGNQRETSYDSLGRRTRQSLPHSSGANPANYEYRYDDLGRLVYQKDPRGQEVNATFDALGRPTAENDLTFAYDTGANAIGRLVKVTGPSYQRELEYDMLGRVLKETKTLEDQVFSAEFTYDLLGAPLTQKYPEGTVVTPQYNGAHQITGVKAGTTQIVSNVRYSPLGQIAQFTSGNGLVLTNTYDPNQMYRLTNRTTLKNGSAKIQKYGYAYDAVGNLLTLIDENNGLTAKTVNYEYDALDRLMEARYTATANSEFVVENYQYDAIGNMTFKSDVGDYAYDTTHPHAVVTAGEQNFAYDAAGNMIDRNGEPLAYDAKGRMISSETLTYSYGEGMDRLIKTDVATGEKTYYPFEFYEVRPRLKTAYIFLGKQRIGKIENRTAPEPTPDPIPDPGTGGDTGGIPGEIPADPAINTTPSSGGGGSSVGPAAARTPIVKASFSNFKITPVLGNLKFTWDNPSNIAKTVEIYRSTESFEGKKEWGKPYETLDAAKGPMTWQGPAQTPGELYYYKLVMLSEKGNKLAESPEYNPYKLELSGSRTLYLKLDSLTKVKYDQIEYKADPRLNVKYIDTASRLSIRAGEKMIPKSGAEIKIEYKRCEVQFICRVVDEKTFTIFHKKKPKVPSVSSTPKVSVVTPVKSFFLSFIPEAQAAELTAPAPEPTFVPETKIYYLFEDHLGNIDVVTDEKGEVVERKDFLPYGAERTSAGESTEPTRFTGKELDENGLYYFGARYYDPVIGRFAEADPWAGDLTDPQTLNKFSYTNNNPLKYIDITGKKLSEFETLTPENGSFFIYGESMGVYRGINVVSGAEKTTYPENKYQCVELAKRFEKTQFGITVGGIENAGDYGNEEMLNSKFSALNKGNHGSFVVYSNGSSMMPREDDLITWSGGTNGHVGVVIDTIFDEKSSTGTVYTIEQNFSKHKGLFSQPINRNFDENGNARYTVGDRGSYKVQGWSHYYPETAVDKMVNTVKDFVKNYTNSLKSVKNSSSSTKKK